MNAAGSISIWPSYLHERKWKASDFLGGAQPFFFFFWENIKIGFSSAEETSTTRKICFRLAQYRRDWMFRFFWIDKEQFSFKQWPWVLPSCHKGALDLPLFSLLGWITSLLMRHKFSSALAVKCIPAPAWGSDERRTLSGGKSILKQPLCKMTSITDSYH